MTPGETLHVVGLLSAFGGGQAVADFGEQILLIPRALELERFGLVVHVDILDN